MAIYYSRLSLVSRSRGHSAVAAAAYRAGARLHDERTDLAHDYTKRRGVLSATMRTPSAAPWALDVATAWNRAEQAEVRRNARTARELVVALPSELTEEQNERLAHNIAQDLVDRYSVAVLVAVHRPDTHGDDRNVHCHLLMSTRVAGPEGFGAKVRVLDDRTSGPIEAEAMRTRVAERINHALALAGHTAQVDPRRLRDQANAAANRGDLDAVAALARTPTRHQGKEASALARRGVPSPIVVENAARRTDNAAVSAWASKRAQSMKRVVQARAARCARRSKVGSAKVAASRQRSLGNGIGPLNAITRATGADAELLNEQAALAQATGRMLRDTSERYLDVMAGEADRQAEELRAYFAQVGRWLPATPAQVETEACIALGARRLPPSVLECAIAARAAYRRAQSHHESMRRRAAKAELRTATARSDADRLDGTKPDVWRPLTRRQWAEHRRRQRAQLALLEGREQQKRKRVSELEVQAVARHQEWAKAHHELLGALDTVRHDAAESSRRPARPTVRKDDDGLRANVERVLSAIPLAASHPAPQAAPRPGRTSRRWAPR